MMKTNNGGCISIPQAHRETAFHFLISNRLAFLVDEEVEAVEEEGPAPPEPSPAGTMVTSVSREAMSYSGEYQTEVFWAKNFLLQAYNNRSVVRRRF